MSDLISQLSSDQTLTSYIAGVGDQSVSSVARFVAPDVPVPKMVGRFKKWRDKDKLVIPDTRRPLGSDGAFIDLTLDGDTYDCKPYALNVGVDFVEQDEIADVINLIQSKARTAASLAAMSQEKRVLDMMTNGATSGSGIDTTGSDDIIKFLNSQLLAVIKGAKGWGAGMELRILFGATALAKIISHSSILSRFKGNQPKGGGYASPTVTDIAGMLMLQANTQVSLMVTDQNLNADAEDVEFLLGSNVLVFASVPNPTDYDTSFMKTFRKMGQTMTARYWAAPSGRQNYAGFDWSEDVRVTNASAGILCAVT